MEAKTWKTVERNPVARRIMGYIANDGVEVLDHSFGGLLILSEFLRAAEQEGFRKLHAVCDTGAVT